MGADAMWWWTEYAMFFIAQISFLVLRSEEKPKSVALTKFPWKRKQHEHHLNWLMRNNARRVSSGVYTNFFSLFCPAVSLCVSVYLFVVCHGRALVSQSNTNKDPRIIGIGSKTISYCVHYDEMGHRIRLTIPHSLTAGPDRMLACKQ